MYVSDTRSRHRRPASIGQYDAPVWPASDLDFYTSNAAGTSYPGSCAVNCTNGFVHSAYPDPAFVTEGSSAPCSFHTGGVNTLFGDGSVRFIKSSVTVATFAALVTRNGGEVIANDF